MDYHYKKLNLKRRGWRLAFMLLGCKRVFSLQALKFSSVLILACHGIAIIITYCYYYYYLLISETEENIQLFEEIVLKPFEKDED